MHLISSLLFISLATFQALADNISIETYCFPSIHESQKAQESAKYLLLPQDKIEAKGECFSVFANETRRELTQKYLLSSYPRMKVSFSSAESSMNEVCDLQVEKTKMSSKTNSHIQISNSGHAGSQHRTESSQEKSYIKAMSGHPFELLVDQQKIAGKCRYITSHRYEIEFSMQFIPKPIISGLPEGATVIVTNPPVPPDQIGTSLSTTVQLMKGQMIEIGAIAKKLNDQGSSISLVPQFGLEKTDNDSQEKIYLMIK